MFITPERTSVPFKVIPHSHRSSNQFIPTSHEWGFQLSASWHMVSPPYSKKGINVTEAGQSPNSPFPLTTNSSFRRYAIFHTSHNQILLTDTFLLWLFLFYALHFSPIEVYSMWIRNTLKC